MKKWLSIIPVIIVIGIILFLGYYWINNTNKNNVGYTTSEYNVERTGQNIVEPSNVESELYSFSTPIKSTDDNRLTNIKITCSRIDGTIVESGKEFSFCDVVGKPSSSDGYKPADAYGKNGKIIKAIGGGNCQVSTTIYNAALGTNGLEVTERHEHNRDVSYVEDGKDATVAYDYLDLKFKNNNDFDIKIYCFVSDKKVYAKIVKIG